MMITPERAIALYHLRQNPQNRTQIMGNLTDGCNGRCALGLVAEAFGLELADELGVECGDVYEDIKERLDTLVSNFYRPNDTYGYSFAKIADTLEYMWTHDLDSVTDAIAGMGLQDYR